MKNVKLAFLNVSQSDMFTSSTINLRDFQKILFAVAYKMIGEVAPSEDIAQDTIAIYLSKSSRNQLAGVQNIQKYLIKIATNRSINYLKKIKKERENYFGVWLPEPIQNESKIIDYQLDMDYGVTFMLGRFTPKERAVFILKTAFDFTFKEIGEAILLKEATCRKTYQRLKLKLDKPTTNFEIEKAAKERLLEGFLAVGQANGLELLIQILKEDIIIYSDGGGKVSAAKNPIFGQENCAKFLKGLFKKREGELSLALTSVNGEMALALNTLDGTLDTIVLLSLTDFKVDALYLVRNPDKLDI